MADETKNPALFIPAQIDDYGFTPEEFRVLCRIMRRATGNGSTCFESVPTMVKALGISDRLVRRALKVLEACGAISRTVRPGQSDVFDFNSFATWKPSILLPQIRAYIDAEFKAKDRTRKTAEKVRPYAETQGATPSGNATTTLCGNATTPYAETLDEGIPLKGIPFKGEEQPPAQAQSFAENTIAADTEKLLGFPFDNFTVERIETVVPAALKAEWFELVKNRLVGLNGKAPNFLKSRIGYWLTDFQKDYRRQLVVVSPEPQKQPVRSEAEKRAAFEKQHYSNRKQPVIYVGVSQ